MLGFLVRILARYSLDLPWIYFPLWMLMSFSFAYAIYKHDLFEFNLLMRRLSIFVGVYLILIGLPVLLFFPFRAWIPKEGEPFWIFLCLVVIGYGFLFSMAPTLTAYLRQKTEKKRWDFLNQQLHAVQLASEKLSNEVGLSLDGIANRILLVLKNFYWNRLEIPLDFVFVTVMDRKGNFSKSIFPQHRVNEKIMKEFLETMKEVPTLLLQKPFSGFNVNHLFQNQKSSESSDVIKNYLDKNGVELCCPCIHNGKLYGTVLLGPKKNGIFWPEELTTLHMVASHIATAVRKSELLSSNKELKDLDHLKTELISNITHEFKAPLYVVENAIDILIKDLNRGKKDTDKERDYLLMIKNNAGLLGLFIQNLLEIARIEQSKVDLKFEKAELKSIVLNAAQLLKPMADKKGLTLSWSSIEPIPTVLDSPKIHQVVSNILSNAIKFTDAGKVILSAHRKNSNVLIMVKDTGRGIEPRFLSSIFNKFFQILPDREARLKGTGLGLAIAKGWVEAHGGRIWAESKGLGKGTSFFIELPVKSTC